MKITAFHLLILFLVSSFSTLYAQNTPFVDIHVNSTTKPFYSQTKKEYNLWDPIDHSCGRSLPSQVIRDFGIKIPKNAQANFESLIGGNVRIVCVNISPIEQEYFNQSSFSTDKNKNSTVACITGIHGDELFLRRKEVDYFSDLLSNIAFIKQYEDKTHYINGKEYKYMIIRSKADIETVLQSNNLIGLVFTVEGAHSVGHSLYINENITELPEYERYILNNINRLKGKTPLYLDKQDLLDLPILFFAPCKFYYNGAGGQALSFNKEQQNVFSKPENTIGAETELGKSIIDSLISKEGRRILIDLKHMNLDFRTYYYKSVERAGILGENIPIVASHCGISGRKWKDALYKRKDDDSKNNNSYLNHWQQNLGEEDIQKIFRSKGLIGISLDKTILAGQIALNEIENTMPDSRQRRQACLKVFMANVLTIVRVINSPKAWDIISIGSDFDAMYDPLDPYYSAETFPELANDIQSFLEHPETIGGDLFTVQEIQRLMFNLPADEIANKIMSTNAIEFMKRNLENAK
ncbi:MAG: peptidase [Saprospiraceae bacterium]|nr:peptidase [Saprospiraceae bacterium]